MCAAEQTMRLLEVIIAPAPSTGNNTSSSHGSKAAGSANSTSNELGAFQRDACYGTDMALVVGILLSAFALGLVLMATIKFVLRRRRGPLSPPPPGDPEKSRGKGGAPWAGTTTVYAAGATELAGAGAECAICLTEFAEGDVLRVLPACRHGFHLECVETWLASSAVSSMRSSPCCPVCRASCPPTESSTEPQV